MQHIEKFKEIPKKRKKSKNPWEADKEPYKY